MFLLKTTPRNHNPRQVWLKLPDQRRVFFEVSYRFIEISHAIGNRANRILLQLLSEYHFTFVKKADYAAGQKQPHRSQ